MGEKEISKEYIKGILKECNDYPFICTTGVTFAANKHPIWEKDQELVELSWYKKFSEANIQELAIMLGYQPDEEENRLEFQCLGYEDPEIGRYRVTFASCRNSLIITLRAISNKLKTFEELNLPKIALANLGQLKKGLVLITGATGQGKTTTISAIIKYIKEYCFYNMNIITLEDPIEYTYDDLPILVCQREVGKDIRSYSEGVYEALRMSPRIIVCGEIRDDETLEAVVKASESGHLVFSTIHTPNAVSTLSHILDRCQGGAQRTRMRIAYNLKAIVSQALIHFDDNWIKPDLIPAIELLYVTETPRQAILEGNLEKIRNYMEESGQTAGKYFPDFRRYVPDPTKISKEEPIEKKKKDNFDPEIAWSSKLTTAELASWTFDSYLFYLYENRIICEESLLRYAERREQVRSQLLTESNSKIVK